ncbi:MAG: EF-P lysine aminoacylase EpmA [Alphaproteobacteria bacterium]
MIRHVREFFHDREYVEVETPALQISPGMEPHVAGFSTRLLGEDRRDAGQMWLHTSPEFAMKKLLVAGMPRIFQLTRCFRNGEITRTHQPEFTMLEWYQTGLGWTGLMDETEAMIRTVADRMGHMRPSWQDQPCDLSQSFERVSVADVLKRDAGINLDAILEDVTAFHAEANRLGILTHHDDSWDDIFFKVFLELCEPKLGQGRATILHSYPASMAALSRRQADDPRYAERFEVYICGMELANAFGELTDAEEQETRFKAEMALKARLYDEHWPVDQDFIAALQHGMPQTSGIALGIDRLAMMLTGAEHIEQVCWLPVRTPA